MATTRDTATLTGAQARRRARTVRNPDTLHALAHRADLLRATERTWPPREDDVYGDDEVPLPQGCLAAALLRNPATPTEAIQLIVDAVRSSLEDPHAEPYQPWFAWPEALLAPTMAHPNRPADLHLRWAEVIRAITITRVLAEYWIEVNRWGDMPPKARENFFHPDSARGHEWITPEERLGQLLTWQPFTVREALGFARDTLARPVMPRAPRALRRYRTHLAMRIAHALISTAAATPGDLTAALTAATTRRHEAILPGILTGVVRNGAATAAHLRTALTLAARYDKAGHRVSDRRAETMTLVERVRYDAAVSASPEVLTHMLTAINPTDEDFDYAESILYSPHLPDEVVAKYSRDFLAGLRQRRRITMSETGVAVALIGHRATDPALITWLTTHPVPQGVREALMDCPRVPLPLLLSWTWVDSGPQAASMSARREMARVAKCTALAAATPQAFTDLPVELKKRLLRIHADMTACGAVSPLTGEVLLLGAQDADLGVRRAASRALTVILTAPAAAA